MAIVKERFKAVIAELRAAEQRFSTGGTRTPGGTRAVARGYARETIKNYYFNLMWLLLNFAPSQ